MSTPAAYLRKSKDSQTKQEHLDRLLDSVHRYGHNGDTVVYDDWARSGDQRKLASRKAWRELCEAIERGDHDVVFMNDLDRGGRSLEEWLRFIRIAQDHKVRVVAGATDYSAPENKDRLIFEAWLAERELDAAKRRAASTIAMRRARGDALGQPPYGMKFEKVNGRVTLVEDPERPLQPVLDVMNEVNNHVPSAMRLLNERGIPSRFGRRWSWHSLTATLRKAGALPPAAKRPRRNRIGVVRMPSALSKIVRCHCGHTMTPVDSRSELYCYVGSRDGAARHGKIRTSQKAVRAFLAAEAAHLRIPFDAVKMRATVERQREALEARRERIREGFIDGLIDRERAKREDKAIEDKLNLLDDTEHVVDVPALDWSAPDGEINAALHALFEFVRLDDDMKPVRAEWRVPEWRRA